MTSYFSFKKTTQAVHFLISKLGMSNFMKLMKLLYFADRYHLRSYGGTLTSDDYKAMKLGPVGSAAKNLLKQDELFFENLEPEDITYFENLLSIKDMDVAVHNPCTYDELSSSEKEALDFTIANFGGFDQFALAEITHDYPEWKKFESYFKNRQAKVIDMENIDFLKNPVLEQSSFIQRYLGGIDPFATDEESLRSIEEYLVESGDCK